MIEAPAKASQIIARARSLSDLPQAKFISHADELDSLNEAWRDLHARLTDSGDDYYLSTATLTISSATLVAGTQYEFLIPLPADFWKLRYADVNLNGTWTPMQKFPISMKDYNTGDPYYRIQGSYLWVVWGGFSAASTSIKIGYYPPPATVTCPDVSLEYGKSYSLATLPGLATPCYALLNRTLVYTTTSGTVITSEPLDTATTTSITPVALFTDSGAVTNLVYYKGTLYWIRGGNIWYKPTQLAAAFLTPTQVGSIANVTAFFIVADTIYYANATQIRTCTLTGGSDALLTTATTTSLAVIGSNVFYVDGSGALKAINPASTLFASGISRVQSDGSYLYVLDTSKNLRKLTVTISTSITVTTDQTLMGDVASISQPVLDTSTSPSTPWIGVFLSEAQKLLAVDASYDYLFSYPNNLVNEIMAYQSAVDYRIKRQEDPAGLLLRLGVPSQPPNIESTGLWARFEKTARRDEYSAERIRNAYDFGYGIMR